MQNTGDSSIVSVIVPLVGLAFVVFYIAVLWRVFAKAGRPGWAAIIPIYNLYVLLKIAGRPGWWVILFLIPLVNFVMGIILAIDVAKSFGRGTGFAVVGLWLFPIVGYPILAFGSAQYVGPAAGGPAGYTSAASY